MQEGFYFYQDKKIKIYLIIELDDLRKVWMVLNLAGLHIEVSKFIWSSGMLDMAVWTLAN